MADKPPLVAEHDTWIDVEPVLGCPASCQYCFLGPMGLQGVRPHVRATPAEAVAALRAYLRETDQHRDGVSSVPTPVAIGNYTDLFMSNIGRQYAIAFAEEFAQQVGDHPLCLITKSELDGNTLSRLAGTGQRIVLYLSQSYGRYHGIRPEKGPVCSPETTLRNAEMIAAFPTLSAVHFWRPFLTEYNPSTSLRTRITSLRAAGFACSVVVGLKVGSGVSLDGMRAAITDADQLTETGDERISMDRWSQLAEIASEEGYAVYRNTSCSVGLVTGTPEALGTFSGRTRVSRCLATTCPSSQRDRCKESSARISHGDDRAVAELLDHLKVSARWRWSRTNNGIPVLRLYADISEFTFNTISHRLDVKVRANSVLQEKAWLGVFTGRAHGV